MQKAPGISPREGQESAEGVPKLVGADCELGNFVLGPNHCPHGTDYLASRALLKAMEGIPGSAYGYRNVYGSDPAEHPGYGYDYSGDSVANNGDRQGHNTCDYDPQDIGRKYLDSNGGCAYIDLNHLEICTPEVTSARAFTAAWHAMLRLTRQALTVANEGFSPDRKIVALVNTSDGHGKSYGSHLNFLVTRRLWDNLFQHKMHPELFVLMAYQVSSIVFCGQGKVGAENGHPPVDYQISQRADFIETLVGPQTTCQRPLVNSRDEALCGPARYRRYRNAETQLPFARLHCIFYDSTLCHVSTFLKVGCMQLLLAMLEAGWADNRDLILETPLDALRCWSRDPSLGARSRLSNGDEVTAVELQLRFVEEAKAFAAAGAFEGYVPDAEPILALWEDTLAKLAARDFNALAPRLDWVLKKSLIERALRQRPELSWASPEIKHLDHLYSSLDEEEGLYWAMERSRLAERVVNGEDIDHFLHEPPGDTRAYTRAMLLRAAGPEAILRVDWDRVEARVPGAGMTGWGLHRTLDMANPLGFTKADVEPFFHQALDLAALLDALADAQPESEPRRTKPRVEKDSSGRQPADACAPPATWSALKNQEYPS